MELYGHLDMKGIMASVKKSDLEKTKLLQCEWTLKDWENESKKVNHCYLLLANKIPDQEIPQSHTEVQPTAP